jgi:hypothetical protein
VHSFLFADDQVVITRGVDDVNFMGIVSEFVLQIFYGKTETQRSFTVIANQWDSNPNCERVRVFGVVSSRE